MPAQLTVQQEGLQALARALKEEADGKKLRRDLSKNLRAALDPIREEAKSNLMGISSAGLSHGASLRAAVDKQMKAEARLAGRSTGARLRVKRRGMPRGFTGAGKALNNPKGWRHPAFGSDTWVQQVAIPPEWFDRATRDGRGKAQDMALQAMEQMGERIARKVK